LNQQLNRWLHGHQLPLGSGSLFMLQLLAQRKEWPRVITRDATRLKDFG
jgi:hypothetical protein